jgi:hypothetical protein
MMEKTVQIAHGSLVDEKENMMKCALGFGDLVVQVEKQQK